MLVLVKKCGEISRGEVKKEMGNNTGFVGGRATRVLLEFIVGFWSCSTEAYILIPLRLSLVDLLA